jgi:hypothetical protein
MSAVLLIRKSPYKTPYDEALEKICVNVAQPFEGSFESIAEMICKRVLPVVVDQLSKGDDCAAIVVKLTGGDGGGGILNFGGPARRSN